MQDRDLASEIKSKGAVKASGSAGRPKDDCSKESMSKGEHLIQVTQLAQGCHCPSKNYFCKCTDDFSETQHFRIYIFLQTMY